MRRPGLLLGAGLVVLVLVNFLLFAVSYRQDPAQNAPVSIQKEVEELESKVAKVLQSVEEVKAVHGEQRAAVRKRIRLARDSLKHWKQLDRLEEEQQQLLQQQQALQEQVEHHAANAGQHAQGIQPRGEGGADSRATPPAMATPGSAVIPILVIACNRPTVRRALDQLLRYRPSAALFPIVVSQDCAHEPTAQVVREYSTQGVSLIQQPDQSDPLIPPNEINLAGYYRIARHYKFALGHVFNAMKAPAVIIVEDDLDVAPDFFEFFSAGKALLDRDATLWCVSAWNDNGKVGQVSDPERLYRSDFFGGLGWMLTSTVWKELEPKWPASYWDDWMRHPNQRKGRACIRPEISRTRTFGRVGVSQGQFYDEHLQFIRLNDQAVAFTKKDLSYLLKDKYDKPFLDEVYAATETTSLELRSNPPGSGALRIEYADGAMFERTAKELGIMSDLKSGVPRTGYLGVVSVVINGRRVFVAPHRPWGGYVET